MMVSGAPMHALEMPYACGIRSRRLSTRAHRAARDPACRRFGDIAPTPFGVLRGLAGSAKLVGMQRTLLFIILATACGDGSSQDATTHNGNTYNATTYDETTHDGTTHGEVTEGGDTGGTCQPHTESDEPDFSAPPGSFALRSQDGFATFDGSVLSAAPLAFHTESSRQGACRLLTYEPSNCAPGCDAGAFCIDGACVATPTALDAGDLTITEFLADPVAAMAGGGAYYWSSEMLGDPSGHATLTATGGEVGPFALSVCVPEPVVAETDWAGMLMARGAGEDVTLGWTNVVPGARVYLRMTTGVGTHGGISPVELECEGPDNGSLTLPGAYLDLLFDPALWSCGECGDNELKRYFAAEAPVAPGQVRFRAEAWTTFFFWP